MRTTTKKFPDTRPKSGKCNIIEGILLGKSLAKNADEAYKPKKMIGKLEMLIHNTIDEHIKGQALSAIELLLLIKHETPASEADRKRIFDFVSSL